MQAKPERGDEHVFVVRMWCEPGGGGEAQWRGSVRHLASTLVRYFTSSDEMLEFMLLRRAKD